MRHLGQDIKRPIAAVGKTEDRGTRATLSIFKGAAKRAQPLQSTWNMVEPESCWCCPCFRPPCISLSVTANKTISSVSYSPYFPTFTGHGWRHATLPSGHSCLIKEKRSLWPQHLTGSAPHTRNNAVYILQHGANRERRFYWTSLKEPHECKQTRHCRLDPLNEGSCLI